MPTDCAPEVARSRFALAMAITLGSVFGGSLPAFAIGINTDVALTPHEGGFVWRSQIRTERWTDEAASGLDRERDVLAWSNTAVYGVTSRFVLGFNQPYTAVGMQRESAGGRMEDAEFGFGDLSLMGKYRFLQIDDPLATTRMAVFGGVEAPTGRESLSSGGYDFVLGPVFTTQGTVFGRFFEWDVDTLYKYHGRADHGRNRGVKPGDVLRYDTSLQYQIWPDAIGGESIVNGVLELGGMFGRSARAAGHRVPATGFHHGVISPGLQLAAERFVLEASVQIPVFRRSRGAQLEPGVNVIGGVRFVF